MHTATQLAMTDFEVVVDGDVVPVEGLFPGWGDHDRLGLLVDEPYGGLGASLLLAYAVLNFYETKPARRHDSPAYPENFVFHMGGPFGEHGIFDVWPPRKEVMLTRGGDPLDVLAAVNDRAVTRLVVPAGPRGDLSVLEDSGYSTWVDRYSALDRVVSCFEYDTAGTVPDADVEIRAKGDVTEFATWALETPEAIDEVFAGFTAPEVLAKLGPSTLVDAERAADRARERAHDVPQPIRAQIAADIQSGANAQSVQTFRRISVDDALRRIVAMC